MILSWSRWKRNARLNSVMELASEIDLFTLKPDVPFGGRRFCSSSIFQRPRNHRSAATGVWYSQNFSQRPFGTFHSLVPKPSGRKRSCLAYAPSSCEPVMTMALIAPVHFLAAMAPITADIGLIHTRWCTVRPRIYLFMVDYGHRELGDQTKSVLCVGK